MRNYRTDSRSREPDELMIPSKNGFIVIPTNSIRVEESPKQKSDAVPSSWHMYRLRNILQFSLMLAGMIGLLGYIGYSIAGTAGLVAVGLVGGIGSLLASNTGVDRLLRSRRIEAIDHQSGYRLYRMMEELAEKAGLDRLPRLFLDRKSAINAYTVEDRSQSAIVVSEALLYSLNLREIKGVLAHEIAHLKNRDIGIMLFSNQIRRLTGYVAIAGQILLVLYLPLMLLNGVAVPWSLLLAMIAAPTVSTLFQIALSRNREFKADLDAVLLSGDTAGLASALRKINIQSSFWQKLYAPYLKEIPELLRTHPNTDDRIRRLKSIQAEQGFNPAWEV